ncbi:MAG TPA: hypothetical protein PKL84_11755 [Candidatus Hydrogenedentes bacterium]|nr:hypothetical protein [Candidatus Hydrogenedentota bacterium]
MKLPLHVSLAIFGIQVRHHIVERAAARLAGSVLFTRFPRIPGDLFSTFLPKPRMQQLEKRLLGIIVQQANLLDYV